MTDPFIQWERDSGRAERSSARIYDIYQEILDDDLVQRFLSLHEDVIARQNEIEAVRNSYRGGFFNRPALTAAERGVGAIYDFFQGSDVDFHQEAVLAAEAEENT